MSSTLFSARVTRFVRRAHRRHKSHPRLSVTYRLLACSALLLPIVFLSTLSTRSPAANLAFFVQVSNSSFLLLPRLLKALWHPKNFYLIHLDAKLPSSQRATLHTFIHQHPHYSLGNVLILPSQHVSYAGISMLLNTINAISVLLKASPDWHYFINLSASDYPLVAPSLLRAMFAHPSVLTARLNFLQRQKADNDNTWFFNRRFRNIHIDTSLWSHENDTYPSQLVLLNASHPVSQQHAQFVKTEGWVILHRSFASHVVDSAESRRLLLSFATSRASDELFFGTLLNSSTEFRDSVTWDAFRFILWRLGDRHWARPAFLDQQQYEQEVIQMLSNSGALFARKFSDTDCKVVQHIETNMSGIADLEYLVDDTAVKQYTELVYKRFLCIVERREDSNCGLSRVA